MPEQTTPRTETVLIHDTPVTVELQRSAKGDYYWNIKVHARTGPDAIADLEAVDSVLQAKYLKKEG